MKILNLLRTLESLEMTMAGLYQWLSERLADQEASAFFFRMSLQEKTHASVLRFSKRLVHASPRDFADVEVDEEEIHALIRRIETFKEEHPEPTLGEALLFAMRAEGAAAENLHSKVIVDSNPEVEKIIQGLAKADAEHHEALKRFVCSHKDEIEVEIDGIC
jgi:rubrerythrin